MTFRKGGFGDEAATPSGRLVEARGAVEQARADRRSVAGLTNGMLTRCDTIFSGDRTMTRMSADFVSRRLTAAPSRPAFCHWPVTDGERETIAFAQLPRDSSERPDDGRTGR